MSNRTMLEINHDYAPSRGPDLKRWAESMLLYMGSGDPKHLPFGVTWFGMRHHSEECQMGDPPRGWQNERAPNTQGERRP